MTETQFSYRQIIKATSLFGGVQIINIIISVMRSKAIAILLGPAGMGIAGLFNAAINLLNGFTNFGLETSAVKSISSINDEGSMPKIISVVKRLVWFSGLLGMVVTIVLSPWLSRITFGNSDYTIAFIWISSTLLFKQLSSGQLIVLQGLRKLEYLAKANVSGSFFGLIVTIPLYYFWKIDAIVPAIILSSIISLLCSWHYAAKIKTDAVKITNRQAISDGKDMLKLGFSLSFIGLLTTLSGYLLQIFIGHTGNLTQVGLFTAGFAIVNSYAGLIFTAMGTDYFPRLVSVAEDSTKVKAAVNQQGLVAVLIIGPIIVLFLMLAPMIVRVLYSAEFLPILNMVRWGILGMLFKAASWSMGYILIAKGDSRFFMKTSLGFNSAFLIINVLGYQFFGLEGLGMTFMLNYIIHFISLIIITSRRYQFSFDTAFYRIFAACLLFCTVAFLFSYISPLILKYSLLAVVAIASCLFSLYEFDKRTKWKEALQKLIKK